MKRKSIKPFLIECGLLSEVSADWKKDFITGAKGMPKTTENIINYAENIYFTAFGGEQNVNVINKKMAKWLVEQVMKLGGPDSIGTFDREKLITVMSWFKIAGSEGNLPKMDLDAAFAFSNKKIEEKSSKEKSSSSSEFEEPPISKIEEEGLVKRVYTIPDGSGRFWVKVDPNSAGAFFDKLCALNKAYGVGCQSVHNGMMHTQHRAKNRTTYTLVGPEKGSKAPITTLMSLSIDTATKKMLESKQVSNQPVGTTLYGWDDLFDKFVEFLGSPIAKESIDYTVDPYTFTWAFNNKKYDALNILNSTRPDFIEASKNIVGSTTAGKEWLETRALDAIDALKKFGPKVFIENIEGYAKSNTFKEALQELSKHIPELSKSYPDLILSRINYLLDFLPFEDFKKMFEHIDFKNYIRTNKDGFEKLLKKLSNVNSADAKSYRDIFKSIIESYFKDITEVFGGGNLGVMKFMNFLEMPKSDKHKFVRKAPDGKIIALKKDVKVDPNTHQRTETNVEFELTDQLSMFPQKERRDLLKKNEEFIKSKIEGDSEKKDINFLRLLFGETNPQDIQRNLKAEKERFIKYYDDPSHVTKYNFVRGVHLPGIFEFYRIFNRGTQAMTAGDKAKPYIKFDLEDIRDPQTAKTVLSFFAKLYKVDNPSASNDSPDFYYSLYDDYATMLQEAGESKEKIEEFIKKYKPTSLKMFKGNNLFIPFTVYEKYYKFLEHFTSKEVVKNDVKANKDEIISRTNFSDYNKLMEHFSTIQYNVKIGDMVEFVGIARKKEENLPNPDEKKLKKYYYLDDGRRYKVVEIDESEIDGITNSRIKVIDNTKKETEWLNTSEFKVSKGVLGENTIVRKAIRNKLFESYIKIKNNG
jgi:hypothetical protein